MKFKKVEQTKYILPFFDLRYQFRYLVTVGFRDASKGGGGNLPPNARSRVGHNWPKSQIFDPESVIIGQKNLELRTFFTFFVSFVQYF